MGFNINCDILPNFFKNWFRVKIFQIVLHSLNIFLVLNLSVLRFLSILLYLSLVCWSSLGKILLENHCCFRYSLLPQAVWFCKIEIYSQLFHFFPVLERIPYVEVLNAFFGILVVSCFIALNFLLLSSYINSRL